MKNRKLLGIQTYDYNIYAKDASFYSIVGLCGHLLFYGVLKFIFGYVEYTLFRLLIAGLFVLFYFVPRTNWQIYHKVYFEAILYLSFPVFFSVMMFANEGVLFWATSYIFATILYTLFAVEIINLAAQVSLLIVVPLLTWLYGTPEAILNQYIGIYLLSFLTVALLVFFKTRVMAEMKEKEVENALVTKNNEMVSSLLYISSELSMYDDPDKVFSIFIERLSVIMALDGILLMLCSGIRKKVMVKASMGLKEADMNHIEEHLDEIIRNESMTVLGENASMGLHDWQVFNKQFDLYNQDGKVNYNLILALPKNTLEDYELGIFHLFFEQLSGNIRTRYMSQEIDRIASTDAMTRLFNRSVYKKTMKILQHSEECYGLIFGDVNGLKYINDTYGHTDGDMLIRTCSTMISEQLPANATAYRYGGDEMLVLVRNATEKVTRKILEKLEIAFENQEILCTDEKTGATAMESVAMSFGMVMSYEGLQEELLDLADMKMREKKDIYYKNKLRERYR